MTSLYLDGDTRGPFPSVSPVLQSRALKSRTTILFGVGRVRNLRRLGPATKVPHALPWVQRGAERGVDPACGHADAWDEPPAGLLRMEAPARPALPDGDLEELAAELGLELSTVGATCGGRGASTPRRATRGPSSAVLCLGCLATHAPRSCRASTRRSATKT